jgi:hypothetical protein
MTTTQYTNFDEYELAATYRLANIVNSDRNSATPTIGSPADAKTEVLSLSHYQDIPLTDIFISQNTIDEINTTIDPEDFQYNNISINYTDENGESAIGVTQQFNDIITEISNFYLNDFIILVHYNDNILRFTVNSEFVLEDRIDIISDTAFTTMLSSEQNEGEGEEQYTFLYQTSASASVPAPVICFKEGTQILTLDLNTGLDTYKNIENINVGDLVSTYKHGYVPVNIIGYSNLINTSSNSRITNKLYVYKKEDHPELTENLYMTGGHSVLLDYKNINNTQREKMIEEMGKLYKTDDKFRLMAKLDYRCDTVGDNRQYRVWHICLDHENEWMNYGIYANGMLVESTCERHAQNFLHKKENVVELIKDHCYLTSLLV